MGLNLLQEEINEAYAQRGWRWEIQIPTSEEGIRLFEETLRADYEASLVDRMIPHQRAYNTVMWRLQGLMPSQENENEQTMTDEARGF